MSDEQAYEAVGLRSDGSSYTVEVLGLQSEDAAKGLAQHYADLWRAIVKLYRVPFVNTGSDPWAEAQMQLVCRIEPTRQPTRLRKILQTIGRFLTSLFFR